MRHLFYLQQFFERLPSPAFIKDNKFRYIWINREWKKVHGLDDRKVIGKTDEKIFNDISSRQIEEKAVKTKKKQEYNKEFDGKYFRIVVIPIRLGDGTYGVAGIKFDETQKYFDDLILELNLKISEIIRELLVSKPESKDFFIERLLDRVQEKTNLKEYCLIKGKEVIKTFFPENVGLRAVNKDSFKEFSVNGEKYWVIPFDEYKVVIKQVPKYIKVVKFFVPTIVPKVENVLMNIEIETKKKQYYTTLEKMVNAVMSWKKTSLEEFLKKVLNDIVEIIPEAEKGTIWLNRNGKFTCVAEVGYPGVENLEFPTSETSYSRKIDENTKKGYLVFEIENAHEFISSGPLLEIFEMHRMTDPSFRPLIGVFKISNSIMGNISVDNFSGIKFSDESKKILEQYVKILSRFLEEYEF